MQIVSLQKTVDLLKAGEIGVLPTDTLYGLVASALDQGAVGRVYRVRARDEGKPCIVLIGDVSDLDRFEIPLGGSASKWLDTMWPGKVSVILPCPDEKWSYLHRGTETIAFRLPDRPELREFLREVGPLVAPSANPQGESPATTIEEAEAYFGDSVDFYVDGGTLDGEPSTLVKIEDGKSVVLREGAVKVANHES